MTKVQSYSLTPVTYKGENREKSGKTNAALKTNVVSNVIGSAAAVGGIKAGLKTNKFLLESLGSKENVAPALLSVYEENMKSLNKSFKRAKWALPVGLLLAAGGGAFVDIATNKKRAEFDEKVKSLGEDKVMETDKHARMSKNGGIYYKTNEGKKWSTIMYGATSALTGVLLKSPNMMKGSTPKKALCGLAFGVVAGSIADACANKSARKAADKEALAKQNVNSDKA